MRSEIGNLTLDETFEEREKINVTILENLKNATEMWGLECLRYEIKDIKVSDTIKKVMNLEAESERKKRAEILLSEGNKTAEINLAEAKKMGSILQAKGYSEQIYLRAKALANRIQLISEAAEADRGFEAAKFQVASKYMDSLKGLADYNKNIVIKMDLADPNQVA